MRATVSSNARCASAGVHAAEAEQGPGEQCDVVGPGAGEARWAHHHGLQLGDERVVEDRVVGRRRPHAERVPRLHDAVAGRVAAEEAVHHLRVLRIAGVHRVHAEVVPHRREAAEDLVTGELPAALHPLGLRARQQERQVVAGLAVTGSQHLAVGGGGKDPVAGGIAHLAQVGGGADPVQVHVDGDGRGRRVVGEAPLQAIDLGQREPRPTEIGGQRGRQVAALTQLFEVLGEEAVLAVVLRRPLVEAASMSSVNRVVPVSVGVGVSVGASVAVIGVLLSRVKCVCDGSGRNVLPSSA